jgi:hypothetical protein
MKKPKIKSPKLPNKQTIQRARNLRLRRGKSTEEKVSEALSNVPRITNDTVSDHREEVLSSARKYIYPLQHSKNRVVRTSIGLFILMIIVFFAATSVSLYKFQSNGTFIYDVTRIVPYPVAKAGHSWVSYESYLFELRRNMHYYQTQQQADFSTKNGKLQLDRLKRQAMAQVIENAYVKQLATANHVGVSNQAVTDQLNLVRSENRLGSSDHVFKEVLNEFWGWDEADFERELKQQLLQQAVVAKLDTATAVKAQSALAQLKSGADFATLASQLSQDPATKANGGQYPDAVTVSDQNLSPAITAAIFKLKPGQISGVVNTGYTLDIVKLLDISGGTAHAAHIQFNLADINTYVQPLQAKNPAHQYIKLPA